MTSPVYFMDDRYRGPTSSLPAKAQQLFDHAKLNECFEPGDSVAIKCHMGEWNNSGYLRPILIRVIVDKVKEHGGRPFVTDTTTAPILLLWWQKHRGYPSWRRLPGTALQLRAWGAP